MLLEVWRTSMEIRGNKACTVAQRQRILILQWCKSRECMGNEACREAGGTGGGCSLLVPSRFLPHPIASLLHWRCLHAASQPYIASLCHHWCLQPTWTFESPCTLSSSPWVSSSLHACFHPHRYPLQISHHQCLQPPCTLRGMKRGRGCTGRAQVGGNGSDEERVAWEWSTYVYREAAAGDMELKWMQKGWFWDT